MFSQLKLYLAIGVLAAFGILYFLYNSAVKDKELITQQYNEMVGRAERDKIKIQQMVATAEANEAVRKEAEQRVQNNIVQIHGLEETISRQRENNDKLAKTLAKHDLKTLITKNQSRMERRMRSATNRLFNEFEAATSRNTDSL